MWHDRPVRVVVYGAGAVGGAIGGLLHRRGHEVSLVARGPHLDALREGGLVLETPASTERIPVHAVGGPGELDWGRPAVVVLAVKSQDTENALGALGGVVPPDTPIVCAQNGVENERRVLRRFPRTYGMCVMCAATHLRPGVVQVHFSPVPGILDLGRYPSGVDPVAEDLAAALRDSTFDAEAVPDIMRWKYRKLVNNVANAVEALCGEAGRGSEIARRARHEAEAVYAAAGIDAASRAEDAERRGRLIFGEAGALLETESGGWRGGSTWQSAVRGANEVEADFLNGEIVLLGRIWGVATPANDLLQRRVKEMVGRGGRPGEVTPEELVDLL